MSEVNITSENFDEYYRQAQSTYFDEYFEEALQEHSVDEETATQVYVADLSASTMLPIQQTDPLTGQQKYVKISAADFMMSVAHEVETTGLMAAMTEEEFDAIFD